MELRTIVFSRHELGIFMAQFVMPANVSKVLPAQRIESITQPTYRRQALKMTFLFFSFLIYLMLLPHYRLPLAPRTAAMNSYLPAPASDLLRESTQSMALPPVAILAGGFGTRLSEETDHCPKPMVEIGGKPILWHVMRHYYSYGMNEFVIALGYKKEAVIRYFLDLHAVGKNVTVRTRDGSIELHDGSAAELDWIVHLIDTGPETMTGGRIKRLAPYVGKSTFMLTWCDGLSDIDLAELLTFHRSHGKLATVTTIRSPSRFGHLEIGGDNVVRRFHEKPNGDAWINGAFFVLEPGIFDYIAGDDTVWEREPLEELVADGQLVAYRHDAFWQCMDTLREKRLLEELWTTGNAPWKIWE
jgi:glucose-1-phosphate cytidylyltransferase